MDWFYVASNALWIIALAYGITLFGMSYWECIQNKVSLRYIFARPKQLGSLYIFLMLLSLGLGLLVIPLWGKILWFSLALISFVMAWSAFNLNHKKR